MAIFLSGLRGVNDEIVKAARLDGASTLSLYWHVIIPAIRSSFVTVFVLLTAFALKTFDLVVAMTAQRTRLRFDLPGDLHVRDVLCPKPTRCWRGERDGASGLLARPCVPLRSTGREAWLKLLNSRVRTPPARRQRVLLYFVLIVLAALFAIPAIVMIMTSLRPTSEIASGALLSFPKEVTFDAWVKAWTTACIGTRCEGLQASFLNSVIATVPVVILTTALGAINGFALTKMKFRGADTIFTMIWLGCFIPYQAVLIPITQTLGKMQLSGSIYGLWVVYTAYSIPFTTLFFRNY